MPFSNKILFYGLVVIWGYLQMANNYSSQNLFYILIKSDYSFIKVKLIIILILILLIYNFLINYYFFVKILKFCS